MLRKRANKPAGDILNPAAGARFLRHTHDQYYTHLQDHFGSTVVALFTDEPMVLGRGVCRAPAPWPFTPGFLSELQAQWEDDMRRWRPAHGDFSSTLYQYSPCAVRTSLLWRTKSLVCGT
jgi:hypothetical protein